MSEKPTMAVTAPAQVQDIFLAPAHFEHVQRVAKVFNQSALVPESFRGPTGLANCIIAMNMAQRLSADPLAVMQSIYIVHGKPSWSAQFIVACINTCGRFAPLKFSVTGTGDDRTCVAWTTERGCNDRLESPPVSIGMAKKEGWFGKNGSKWQTMPELMLRYRAATFFGRLYAPDILMGMRTQEELSEIVDVSEAPSDVASALMPSIPVETAEEKVENADEVVKLDPAPEAPPAPVEQPKAAAPSTQSDELADLVTGMGYNFDDFSRTIKAIGWDKSFPDCGSWTCFGDIPEATRKRIVGAKRGLIVELKRNGGAK